MGGMGGRRGSAAGSGQPDDGVPRSTAQWKAWHKKAGVVALSDSKRHGMGESGDQQVWIVALHTSPPDDPAFFSLMEKLATKLDGLLRVGRLNCAKSAAVAKEVLQQPACPSPGVVEFVVHHPGGNQAVSKGSSGGGHRSRRSSRASSKLPSAKDLATLAVTFIPSQVSQLHLGASSASSVDSQAVTVLEQQYSRFIRRCASGCAILVSTKPGQCVHNTPLQRSTPCCSPRAIPFLQQTCPPCCERCQWSTVARFHSFRSPRPQELAVLVCVLDCALWRPTLPPEAQQAARHSLLWCLSRAFAVTQGSCKPVATTARWTTPTPRHSWITRCS